MATIRPPSEWDIKTRFKEAEYVYRETAYDARSFREFSYLSTAQSYQRKAASAYKEMCRLRGILTGIKEQELP